MAEVVGIIIRFSSSYTSVSTAINSERANLLVVTDTDSLEYKDWSNYQF